MARVDFNHGNRSTGQGKMEALLPLSKDAWVSITNMKQVLLQDYATYDAFMGLVHILEQIGGNHWPESRNHLCALGIYHQRMPALLAVLY